MLVLEALTCLAFIVPSQYAFFRPAISIAGIICEAFGKLCPEEYSVYFAEVYLEALDVSSRQASALSSPGLTHFD